MQFYITFILLRPPTPPIALKHFKLSKNNNSCDTANRESSQSIG